MESPAPPSPPPASIKDGGSGYWLTRFVLLRFLGFVYFIAFLVAANQLVPLIGHHGLTPADVHLQRLVESQGSTWAAFRLMPSVFFWDCSDTMLRTVAWSGVVISAVVMCGYANSLMMLILWALYMSITNVGQYWYSFGWDIQIQETGFLAVFLCPLLDGRPYSRRPPPVAVIWLYRWLIFRIMLGAGLIKIRGDECWRDLTALYYHYETQPVPNPLSRTLHFMPHWFQRFGVMWNHFIELVVPWFIFFGRVPSWEKKVPLLNTLLQGSRHLAGLLMVSFQVILIFSGNLSFLNWLTIVPCLACFDDDFWKRLLPQRLVQRMRQSSADPKPALAVNITACAYTCVVIELSVGPVMNLLSPTQLMNTSFFSLPLVNSYGAFGSVDRVRQEIIIEGTNDLVPNDGGDWREYPFVVKPGDLKRRPPIITPYHYRLDWQIWFVRGGPVEAHPWLVNLVWKLLHNDPRALGLLAGNPFPDAPPRFIRVSLYEYHFAKPGNADGTWWERKRLGLVMPPMHRDNPGLQQFLRAYRWLEPAQ